MKHDTFMDVSNELESNLRFRTDAQVHAMKLPGLGTRMVTIVMLRDPENNMALARGISICNPVDEYHKGTGVAMAYVRALRDYTRYLREVTYKVMKVNAAHRAHKQRVLADYNRITGRGKRADPTHEARLRKALESGKIRACPVTEKYYAASDNPLERDFDGGMFSMNKCPHCGVFHKAASAPEAASTPEPDMTPGQNV